MATGDFSGSMPKEYYDGKKLFERKITEEDVLQEIVVRLRFSKIQITRIRENLPTGYRMSETGIPDLIGYVPKGTPRREFPIQTINQEYALWKKIEEAIHIEIEVKKPGEMAKYHAGGYRCKPKREKTFRLQEERINQAKADGCIACFAESWQNVVDEFAKHGIQLPK